MQFLKGEAVGAYAVGFLSHLQASCIHACISIILKFHRHTDLYSLKPISLLTQFSCCLISKVLNNIARLCIQNEASFLTYYYYDYKLKLFIN